MEEVERLEKPDLNLRAEAMTYAVELLRMNDDFAFELFLAFLTEDGDVAERRVALNHAIADTKAEKVVERARVYLGRLTGGRKP